MVATTFASDTPNLVTDIVRKKESPGTGMVGFYSHGDRDGLLLCAALRRSGVMTDLEFYEQRYSGKAATFVRGFRSPVPGNFSLIAIIMATVQFGGVQDRRNSLGMPRWQTLLIIGVLNVTFAAHSGLWGALVIDMIQFFVKMTAVIAAAWFAVKHVGGMHVLIERLSAPRLAPDGKNWAALFECPSRFQKQLGAGACRFHHAFAGQLVGCLVSRF